MTTLDLIYRRRSVREYLDKKISKEDINKIVTAGLYSPSACNKMPWKLIIVEDKELIEKMADVNGKSAESLKKAPLAIMICMDNDKALPQGPLYPVIDCALMAENMVIAALSLGIGSCYFGTWPQEYKVNGQKELFNLPNNLTPHLILSFGYPKGDLLKEELKEIDMDSVLYL